MIHALFTQRQRHHDAFLAERQLLGWRKKIRDDLDLYQLIAVVDFPVHKFPSFLPVTSTKDANDTASPGKSHREYSAIHGAKKKYRSDVRKKAFCATSACTSSY
jgi:hypothetical protein